MPSAPMASSSSSFSLVSVLGASLLLLLLLLTPPAFAAAAAERGDVDGSFTSVYSFGDSIADTGNLIRESPKGADLPFAHLPYGETTFKEPTGRCSDGLLMIDYLAKYLNLPLLNPYLDKAANFDHGVNFAVAGATALKSSYFDEQNIFLPFTKSSLDVQLDWFKTHLKSICDSKTDCERKIEKALFLVGEIGGNDYNFAFIEGKAIEEVKAYVPLVVEKIKNAAKELIDNGAKHLVIPGNFPIGCMPVYLKTFSSSTNDSSAYDKNKCLKEFNSFAMFHNDHLQEAVKQLSNENPGIPIMYADYYNTFMLLIEKAPIYGFNESSLLEACCGTGEPNTACGAPGVSACPAPSNHISWDGVHLTQAAYKIMVEELNLKIHLWKETAAATAAAMKIKSRKLGFGRRLISS